MRRSLAVSVIAPALLIAACGGAATPSPSPEPTQPAATTAPSATASEASSPGASSSETAVPTALDPCQLVTASEASTLAGATFTTGKEDTTSGGAKMCVYGAQTLNVFQVTVAVAPDAATAQAQFSALQTQAEDALKNGAPSGVSVTLNTSDVTLTGADKAAVATAGGTFSGVTLNVSAIYVLKGATFFSFSDLVVNAAAPTAALLEAQAQTTLGRIP